MATLSSLRDHPTSLIFPTSFIMFSKVLSSPSPVLLDTSRLFGSARLLSPGAQQKCKCVHHISQKENSGILTELPNILQLSFPIILSKLSIILP